MNEGARVLLVRHITEEYDAVTLDNFDYYPEWPRYRRYQADDWSICIGEEWLPVSRYITPELEALYQAHLESVPA